MGDKSHAEESLERTRLQTIISTKTRANFMMSPLTFLESSSVELVLACTFTWEQMKTDGPSNLL